MSMVSPTQDRVLASRFEFKYWVPPDLVPQVRRSIAPVAHIIYTADVKIVAVPVIQLRTYDVLQVRCEIHILIRQGVR